MVACTEECLLRLTDVGAGYGKGLDVISSLSLSLHPGRLVAIVGSSGSGKSTLLRILAGIHPMRYGTRALHSSLSPSRAVSWLAQGDTLLPWRDVYSNVHIPCEFDRQITDRNVQEALTWCSIDHLAQRNVETLSGGQRRMVAFARMIAENRQILLLDEPFVNIDEVFFREMAARLMRYVKTHRRACCFVTHDCRSAVDFADEVCLLARGRLCHTWHVPREIGAEQKEAMVREILESLLQNSPWR